jgi:threonine synthase
MTQEQFITDELQRSMQRMVRNMISAAQSMGIGVTGALISSIKERVAGHIGELYFNPSGRFRDMGVGRGVSLADVKGVAGGGRKKKRFYSRTAYSEVGRFVYNVSNRFVEETVAKMQKLDGLKIEV